MTLSIATVSNAPPERLEPWLLHVLGVADEVVVTLDAAAPPESVEVARRLADDVAVAELGGVANPAYDWTAGRATGDWVLVLDDDELLSPGFGDRVADLMADRRYTHYHLPVRWVVPGGVWLRRFPWWPNHATRLFRNVGGLARHGAEPHSSWKVFGEGRALDGDDVCIYHLDLALRDRAARERKVTDAYAGAGAAVPSCEEYYLYEDYPEQLETAPVPAGALEPSPTPRALARAAANAAIAAQRPEPVRRSHAELLEHVEAGGDAPPIWAADYLAHDTPSVLGANRGHSVVVRVRNTSRASWRSLGQVTGRVLLSYRWFRESDGAAVIPQGDISLLPEALAPGEEATILAGLWSPAEPGVYRLEWDMLCENVAWFSDRGVTPLAVRVEVRDRGPRPTAPHFASAPAQAETETADTDAEQPRPAVSAPRRPLLRALRALRST